MAKKYAYADCTELNFGFRVKSKENNIPEGMTVRFFFHYSECNVQCTSFRNNGYHFNVFK